ncbi:MAG: YebC/PmpR family DNA-binding transcriptional regulator [Oscillospiraceae bacterium]|nr:YebC/PmpR family DNA-binding transcriptional regulator [Oscillospiraceae bacterium]
MSGHSRWSTIKRKKEKSDANKGKVFTKIGRELAVAVKEGGSDAGVNSRLRECILKAKAYNVPNENIERIIKKASGSDSDENYESFIYEGYGPAGSAFMVDILTENRNRTSASIRKYFNKNGGNLGTSGCVSFMFRQKGVAIIKKNENYKEEKVMEDAILSGAEDFESEKDCFIIISEKSGCESVKRNLLELNYEFLSTEIAMIPDSYIKITDYDLKLKAKNLIDALEDDDDVQNVWHNCEFDD